jgi:hypothetical protein
MVRFESWEIDNEMSFVYTNDWVVARELASEFAVRKTNNIIGRKTTKLTGETVYYRHASAFAWQYPVRSRIIPILEKKFKEYRDPSI